MSTLGYLVTLLVGIILSVLLFNPLSALVYVLVWFDILVLARIPLAESIGFELLTLSAIIGGVALGPAGGFLFSLIGIPILAALINAAVFRTFSPRVPSVDFIAMGIAAILASSLIGPFSLFAAVLLAVILKHVIMNAINILMGGGINYVSIINILFTSFVIIVLKEIGLL